MTLSPAAAHALTAALTGRVRVSKAAARIPAGKVPQRFTLGVAYPAMRVDKHGEMMTTDELERTAWAFSAEGRQIGLYHADRTVGHGTVVESYIYRGPDWPQQDINGAEQVIKAGDWVLGVVWDERAWSIVSAPDGPDGWSIDGVAKRRRIPAPRRAA